MLVKGKPHAGPGAAAVASVTGREVPLRASVWVTAGRDVGRMTVLN